MKKMLATFALLFILGKAFSDVRLPALLASDMVLQQKSAVSLWGWASPGETVYITTSWDNHTDSVMATSEAMWKLKVNTPAAGGPYTITFRGANTIKLENILIGEVWVCSGQSNMEWSSNQNLPQMMEELPKSANSNIRLFRVDRITSATPQDDVPATWKVCGPESLKGFSAVGYFFAKKLQQQLNIPVGIISAAWGGTPAEVWTPAPLVTSNPELKAAAEKIEHSMWWTVTPGAAYNAMIYPLTNYNIAGAIWYQGESNTKTAATYAQLLDTMVTSWRSKWNNDFPFYLVQIAPYHYDKQNIGALLREQQTNALQIKNTGMVVITDLVDNVKDIHPKNKIDVAARLANMALSETYHQSVGEVWSPMFKNMEISKDKAVLYFDNAKNGFVIHNGTKASDFMIAGEDKNFYPADVKLEKDKIIVSSKQVKVPVAVRFGFSNMATPNVFSKDGLPVAPFRTDNWPVPTPAETE
ncbi:sialate O-acetylesterase [Chitinophaga sp. Cy-1792]|uniref:sialate O-acetylesterase n=1 Tax=Chitinophaga sp. Cy-1792 TaxID=2608339 RepID=UPI00141FABC2|nr:sialate O-acetylesterase [Chitinophaga sp. Cy-1792]NIG53231.1 sialate O-acetylesterase [Chitinophaga sp. Cy-1792]